MENYIITRLAMLPSANIGHGPFFLVFQVNFLLTERDGRTGEYWPEVVAVQKRPMANIPQYGPSKLG